MKIHKYYVYILTNKNKSVFYIGVSNNLDNRLKQHKQDCDTLKSTFAGKYSCIYLIYFEEYQWVQMVISREKELKKWSREKKLNLIRNSNPDFNFLHNWE